MAYFSICVGDPGLKNKHHEEEEEPIPNHPKAIRPIKKQPSGARDSKMCHFSEAPSGHSADIRVSKPVLLDVFILFSHVILSEPRFALCCHGRF